MVGDDTLFPWEPYPADWAIDDAVWGYGAPVSALSVNDNQIRVTVTPGAKAGDAGGGDARSGGAVLHGESGLTTGAARSASVVGMERAPGSRVLRVYGAIAADAGADVEEVAIEDPAEYAAVALKGMLEARGIVVTGVARAQHGCRWRCRGFLASEEPIGLPSVPRRRGWSMAREARTVRSLPSAAPELLATHRSAAVGEDVGVTNKMSLNLHAELLLRRLGQSTWGATDRRRRGRGWCGSFWWVPGWIRRTLCSMTGRG